MTSLPVNMTSSSVHMTSPPLVNATSPIAHMTSSPVNITSFPVYMTSPPVNKACTDVYGSSYRRSIVNSFTSGSVVVDTTLVFNDDSSVPSVSNATTELRSVFTSSSTSLNIISGTVNATSSSSAASTAATTTTTATATTTETTTTASTDPPTSSEGTVDLNFSLNQTFSSDLSNSSSEAYQILVAKVVKELNGVGANVYGPSFLRSIVNALTNGSVVVDSTLVFKDKNSVPSASNISSEFTNALTSPSSSLNVISTRVSAQSTSTSSSPPRPTMGSLAVFSLTLLALAQILMDL
ncbi:cell wall integrity and stress response component 4-like [Sebastes umbrosus]|uniref:cell wall integrity and stress response component 4-like n=1 Tax=Sebastes umbrosus TaxID=72105 RepID=UPI00189F7D03|nr:cell wall integrity and stress response component 4-like [Sebastes umbrosus]